MAGQAAAAVAGAAVAGPTVACATAGAVMAGAAMTEDALAVEVAERGPREWAMAAATQPPWPQEHHRTACEWMCYVVNYAIYVSLFLVFLETSSFI